MSVIDPSATSAAQNWYCATRSQTHSTERKFLL
jgi:hypothetical protein